MLEKTYTQNTNEYMFKYLEKYVGKYRVLAEYDLEKKQFPTDDSFEDYYIPCKKNCVIKHTYEGDDILALFVYDSIGTAKNIIKELKNLNIDFEADNTGTCADVSILFNAKDLDKVAKLVKAKTSGKSIHPKSSRNLPKGSKTSDTYIVPEKDVEKLNELVKELSQVEKMQLFRKLNKEFLEEISKKDKIDYKEKMKMDGYNARQIIHSTGNWDKYITFVKKNLKK